MVGPWTKMYESTMNRLGNWWVPSTENLDDIESVKTNNFSCVPNIAKAVQYVKNFRFAIDIGTWIGDSTSCLSGMFDQVLGFEANPVVYECCVRNIKDRKLYNVNLLNYALSNIRGTVPFCNSQSTFSGWIDTIGSSSHTLVTSLLLDDFEFDSVDFIKIDVDSHEGFLLQGSQNFFNKHNPVVLIEYKPKILKRQSSSMPDPIELLKSHGYSLKQQVDHIDFIYTR